MTGRAALPVLVLAALLFVLSSVEGKQYLNGEIVDVYANRVGPFNNPQEYFMYHSLPFCRLDKPQGIYESLGESISGYELRLTPIDVRYGTSSNGFLCEKELNTQEAALFSYAVEHQFWYQFFVDNLPVWGMVGEVVEVGTSRQLYIYTHQHFDISKNGDRIVEVALTSENAVPIEVGSISFTYSIDFHDSTLAYESRFDKYLDFKFYEHRIHWFSVFNAIMLLVFLVGLVLMILLRTLRREFTAGLDDEKEEDALDDSGWKLLHRDVFRPPNYNVLFAATVGSGIQLLVCCFAAFIFIGASEAYRSRGGFVSWLVTSYIFSSFVGGYASGRIYTSYRGPNWIKTMLFQTAIIPGTFGAIILICNIFAKSYGALSHVPVLTLMILVIIWAFIVVPFTLIGTLVGRHTSGPIPVHQQLVNKIGRMIPDRPWYLQPWVNISLGGLLPFASIFIELYFLYTSFWHYKYYYVFGFATLILTILTFVSACVSIIATYFLLNNENHKWHWKAFFTGASTGLYVFLYSIYYYRTRTNMTGVLQLVLYVGYTSIISIFVGFLCGGAAFYGASWFVNKIYSGLKVD